MMKQPLRIAKVSVAMTFVLSMFTVLSIGCGAVDADAFLGLEICDILNCDGLFFGNLADQHVDDVDDHDDDGDDDHANDADDHDDEDGDNHADDADDHVDDDVEESEDQVDG